MVGDFLNQTKGKKRTQKKKRRKKIPYVIVLVILLYFISRMPSLLMASSNSTYPVQYGKIEKNLEVTGYVVREEKVFTSLGNGEVKYFVDEGKKVSKGEKLAEVYIDDSDEGSRKDLATINLRLENIKENQNTEGVFQGDIEKIKNQIQRLILSIQQDIKDERYDRIDSMRSELEDLLNKQSIIAGEKSFSGKNLSELEEQKTRLEEKVNASVQVIYSDSPGFIALGSDGLEELLNYKTITDINSDQLKMIEESKIEPSSIEAKEGAPVIRIIKNYKWSLIVSLSKEESAGMEKGNTLKIRPVGQNKELKASIRDVVEEEDKNIIVFDLDEFVDNIYNIRKLTVDIIRNKYEGTMIANSSIVEKDGIEGVYTVDVTGTVQFKPIKIKTSNLEYAIVHDGYFEKKSDKDAEKIERVTTINLYDEVVTKGSKVKEGQRIR